MSDSSEMEENLTPPDILETATKMTNNLLPEKSRKHTINATKNLWIGKCLKKMSAPTIGIDLGTTFSCAAVFSNGRPEVILNSEGNRVTPSYVAFTDKERIVGDEAKHQDATNPSNTIYDVKRLIGVKFDDPYLQDDMKHWPFQVVKVDDKPKIKVQYKGKDKTLYPEEVSSMILSKLKETAETVLGKTVKNAVITVPAYFNHSQRQATKDAGTIAGLNVIRIINEPTAAALAYGFGDNTTEERNILIFDLGGGTFDVSVLNIEEGIIEVKATAGNAHLGGANFDNRMVDHIVEEFKRKYKQDLSTDKKALRRIQKACERAKRTLSSTKQASINLELLYNGKDFQTSITRALFEELNADLFKATITLVEQTLEESKIEKSNISDILLIGGSTRIPMVQKLVQDFFDGKELNRSINPDEAVACGAAIQAAMLDGKSCQDITLVDVTSLSLGNNHIGGIMSTVIKRNTTIPTKQTITYETVLDNQTQAHVKVYEGERPMYKDNNYLGEFILSGIPPAPRGISLYDITFEINVNGILEVTAVVGTATENKKQLTISDNVGRLSREQVQKLVKEAELYELEDKRQKETVEARNQLERLCYQVKNKLNNSNDAKKLSLSDKQKVSEMCEQTLGWLQSNPRAEKKEYQERLNALNRLCHNYEII